MSTEFERAPQKYLDGDCPDAVLAIYDDPQSTDRYTIFYTRIDYDADTRTRWIAYRAASENPSAPTGIGLLGQMDTHEARQFRNKSSNQYTHWTQLPAPVKDTVKQDINALAQG
ncbi:hypothetical protein BKG82_26105 [Mycobacteroides chelonae]|uniref:Uncharacterized protein n=1 Tax=Mycobacteroides chelonae TaxID=1774 RepID=A0A1S1LKL7_MYCCH|nr:hypothetical protein [Mycobacteroides chelonae]OHU47134.1 hypothetical protein BKG82_26105 [Mycobacteroides chelonae]